MAKPRTIPLLISDNYDIVINEVDIHTEEMLQAVTTPKSKIVQEIEEMELESDSNSESDSESNLSFEFMEMNEQFKDSELDTDEYDRENDELYSKFEIPKENETDLEYVLKPAVNKNDDLPVQTLFRNNEEKCDYLNAVRRKVINDVNAVRNENLKYFESIRSEFERDISKLSNDEIEALRARLFANKFSFVVKFEVSKGVSKLLVFFVDFYLSQNEIEILTYVYILIKKIYL